jgi:hypothetical protein
MHSLREGKGAAVDEVEDGAFLARFVAREAFI